MSELTNKELASALLQIYTESDSMWARKRLELAAERLAQYPDMHHTEATNFRDLANKFLKMRDERDLLQSRIDSMVDQRSKLHSRFKDRKGQANPEADFMAPNDPVERLAAMPDAGAIDIINGLLDYAWRQTCTHEETHRAGFLWEICDSCGMKWADDEGGRPEFETPKAIMDAEVYLAKIRDGKLTTESPDCETIKRYCLEFCKYLSKRGVLCSMFGPEKLAEQFLQQQSSESDK